MLFNSNFRTRPTDPYEYIVALIEGAPYSDVAHEHTFAWLQGYVDSAYHFGHLTDEQCERLDKLIRLSYLELIKSICSN